MRLSARHRLQSSIAPAFWDFSDAPTGRRDGNEVVRFGSGEPIVILPGLAGGRRLLAPLARELARRHEVFLLGFRGDEGVSGQIPAQRPMDHAHDVAETISRLGLERPTVLGVSFGGAVALELAAEMPRSVGGLILYGAEDRFFLNLGATIAVRALERFPLPRDSRFVNQFFNILHGCRPEPGPMVDFIVKTCWETDQGVVASRLRGLEGFSMEDRLWKIDAPTLVMAGSRDVVVPPKRQKAFSTSLAGAHFEAIDGAGHVGFVTHRKEVARLVGQMVRERMQSLC